MVSSSNHRCWVGEFYEGYDLRGPSTGLRTNVRARLLRWVQVWELMQQSVYKTSDVWGLNIRYLEAGDSPVVLMLYDLSDSLLSWYRNIDPLADAEFRVIAPDMPGSGESDKPGHLEYDPDSATEFVYDFTQELGIDKLSLVGNSAGGLVVGLFSLEHPEMVEKMALVASGGFGRRVSWLLRIISVPILGEILYQPRLNSKMGLTRRLFYRPPDILEELLPKNISTQIFKAFLENAASEQGSRMTAMDNATRNAGDLVDKLTINYNRSRQASITKELIEIISGAESL